MFSAERSDGGILSTDEVSYMYEPLNSPYCFENGSADEARSFYANCAEDRIKSKNDNC